MEEEVNQGALPGMELGRGKNGERYSQFGKQVLCDGQQYADAVSAEAAENTVTALNALDLQADWVNYCVERIR